MCGIAGDISFAKQPDVDALRAMCARISHRGPDFGSVFSDGPVALGHRRLSILDTRAAAHQPMEDPSGRYVMVFNGEIYNFKDLRKGLETQGHVFKTSGDSEVLLAAFAEYGKECLSMLNGMFAFVIWDRQERRIFAARDRTGKKPLYYFHNGNRLIFCSELKGFFGHPDVSLDISAAALGQYLSVNYTVGPQSILSAIKRLPAGYFMTFSAADGLHQTRYWDLEASFENKPHYKSEGAAIEAFLALFDDAVKLRLVSDVPLGAFLSGGIDSSSIVSSMCLQRDPALNRTYSIGFEEESYSELPQAAAMAKEFGVVHNAEIVTPNLGDDLERIVAAADEPFADTSVIPTYYLARFARQHVTVALSGDGGDELFGGYETYKANRLSAPFRKAPKSTALLSKMIDRYLPVSHKKVSLDYKLRYFMRHASLPFPQAHWSWRQVFASPQERGSVLTEKWHAAAIHDSFTDVEQYFDCTSHLHPIDQASFVDIKSWMVDDILVKVDRMSMAHSLEVRAPFLDYRVIEFAAGLPPAWKLRGLNTKYFLRKAFAERLPSRVLKAPKLGFNAPVSPWLNGPLSDRLRDLVRTAPVSDVIRWRAVDKMIEEHSAQRADHGHRLFNLLVLAIWLTQKNDFT
jgi:asparagine synthase (glutamine-hydrolysing)